MRKVRSKKRFLKSRPDAIPSLYTKWVSAVFKRDKHICQMCGYKSVNYRSIQAHHIKKWANYPRLRYVVSNGITLCYNCHKSIWGKEEQYETIFYNKLNLHNSHILDIKADLWRAREEDLQSNS